MGGGVCVVVVSGVVVVGVGVCVVVVPGVVVVV